MYFKNLVQCSALIMIKIVTYSRCSYLKILIVIFIFSTLRLSHIVSFNNCRKMFVFIPSPYMITRVMLDKIANKFLYKQSYNTFVWDCLRLFTKYSTLLAHVYCIFSISFYKKKSDWKRLWPVEMLARIFAVRSAQIG